MVQFRLILGFLYNERLTEGCPLVLEGGLVPVNITACFQVPVVNRVLLEQHLHMCDVLEQFGVFNQ